MRVSTLPLAILLFGLLLVPRAAVAQSWSAAADFEKGWTAKTNPNGVWSYGYSSDLTSPITLYDQTLQDKELTGPNAQGINGPNAQYWLSPAVDVLTTPAAEYNDGPAYNDGNIDFLANEFLLLSGVGGQYSDLVFTAPAAATYSIVSEFRGAQYTIGTVVGVVANGEVLFSSKVTSVDQLVPFNTEVSLKAGDTLVFSVGPGGGTQNTGLSATITTVPFTLSSADLYLRIIPTTTTVHQGDLLTYAFPVWNLGPDNANLEVLNTQVPAGTVFDYIRISGTPGLGTCSYTPYLGAGPIPIVCNENSAMAPNTTWTVRLTVKVTAPAGTVITESAATLASTADPNLANNTATVSLTVVP